MSNRLTPRPSGAIPAVRSMSHGAHVALLRPIRERPRDCYEVYPAAGPSMSTVVCYGPNGTVKASMTMPTEWLSEGLCERMLRFVRGKTTGRPMALVSDLKTG